MEFTRMSGNPFQGQTPAAEPGSENWRDNASRANQILLGYQFTNFMLGTHALKINCKRVA